MIQFRCELCDDFLPIFQMSKLCPTCYKIRTILKCYSSEIILENLEKKFIVNDDKIKKNWVKDENGKWIKRKPEDDSDNDADDESTTTKC